MTSGPLSCEENVLLKDAKYRYYVTSIDKVLKLFDNSSEWADLIPALGKLNKVCSVPFRFYTFVCLINPAIIFTDFVFVFEFGHMVITWASRRGGGGKRGIFFKFIPVI